MLNLPNCPHCHTIYRYGDVKKALTSKECKCYSCGKSFKVKRKKIIILAVLTVIISSLVNIFELNFLNRAGIAVLIITNILLIIVAFLLVPFFTGFGKDK